jgi:hypothetical protein
MWVMKEVDGSAFPRVSQGTLFANRITFHSPVTQPLTPPFCCQPQMSFRTALGSQLWLWGDCLL